MDSKPFTVDSLLKRIERWNKRKGGLKSFQHTIDSSLLKGTPAKQADFRKWA